MLGARGPHHGPRSAGVDLFSHNHRAFSAGVADDGGVVELRVPGVGSLTGRIAELRARLGADVFQKVAGDEGPNRRKRIHSAPGPRWFAADRPIRRVHGDASMFVGGLRALLLQSLHPLAMAGVAGHSGYRGDPWGRLPAPATSSPPRRSAPTRRPARRSSGSSRCTPGSRGRAPDGRAYSAGDPHLLEWVHIAEIDSFLRAHQRYGSRPLDQAGCDGYVADTARIARELGVTRPAARPRRRSRSGSRPSDRSSQARPRPARRPGSCCSTRRSRSPARAPYALLAAAAVELLPPWARAPLRLPHLPVIGPTLVRGGGQVVTMGIRWVMSG